MRIEKQILGQDLYCTDNALLWWPLWLCHVKCMADRGSQSKAARLMTHLCSACKVLVSPILL